MYCNIVGLPDQRFCCNIVGQLDLKFCCNTVGLPDQKFCCNLVELLDQKFCFNQIVLLRCVADFIYNSAVFNADNGYTTTVLKKYHKVGVGRNHGDKRFFPKTQSKLLFFIP